MRVPQRLVSVFSTFVPYVPTVYGSAPGGGTLSIVCSPKGLWYPIYPNMPSEEVAYLMSQKVNPFHLRSQRTAKQGTPNAGLSLKEVPH